MALIDIKQYITDNLPSNQQIPITLLVAVLKAMCDDAYAEFPEGGLEFTQEMLDHLISIEEGAQVNPTSHEISFINGLQDALNSKTTEDYVDNTLASEIGSLINNAPELLNTLGEIAAAINNDPDFYNSILSLINSKANKYTVYGELQVHKGPSGIDDEIIEAGDICRGWLTPTIFLEFGVYVSGPVLDILSYDASSLTYTDLS